jgi:hypothetical protein
MRAAALLVGAMFVVFSVVDVGVVRTVIHSPRRDLFDIMAVLFQAFWLMGWSVGVLILGVLTLFLAFYRESARIEGGRLVVVPRLGPVRFVTEYDLAGMSQPAIDQLIQDIRSNKGPTRRWKGSSVAPAASPTVAVESDEPAPPRILSVSGAALIAANLIPLAGVLFFGWDLSTIMVLFWAESAVIGFFTVLKMVIVGKLVAIVAVPFFVGHYGGFMAMHFLFIYLMFVRGLNTTGPDAPAAAALRHMMQPLMWPLAGLFVSHGVSFFFNFIKDREYQKTTVSKLMSAPYARIVMMQLTVIFGGWIVLLLHTPTPALAILVALKTFADFTAHRTEHA